MPSIYECKVVGDGLSHATAFRPAIGDLRDLNGKPYVNYKVLQIVGGKCLVAVEGDEGKAALCLSGLEGQKTAVVQETDVVYKAEFTGIVPKELDLSVKK